MKKAKKGNLPLFLVFLGYALNAVLILKLSVGVLQMVFLSGTEHDFGLASMAFILTTLAYSSIVGPGVFGLSVAALVMSGDFYKDSKDLQRRTTIIGIGNLVLLIGMAILLGFLILVLFFSGSNMEAWSFAQGYGVMCFILVLVGLAGVIVAACRTSRL